jgi:type VI secretion system secreted protein VgrG
MKNPRQQTLEISSPAIPLFLGRPALEPVSLSGHEGVNSLFEYTLLVQTPEAANLHAMQAADWEAERFARQPMRCSIELDGAGAFLRGMDRGAGVRQVNAIVTRAESPRQVGRQLQFNLTLRPWLFEATLQGGCRLFQDMTPVEVLKALLATYAHPVDWTRLGGPFFAREHCNQYNETDFEFLSRITQHHGINYWFEHHGGDHTLVLSDGIGGFRKTDNPAYQAIEIHPPGLRPDAEHFREFTVAHEVTSTHHRTSDYDYTRPGLKPGQLVGSSLDAAGSLAIYRWHAPLGGSRFAQPLASSGSGSGSSTPSANDPYDEGVVFARLRQEAQRTHAIRARASGSLRGMVPGRSFAVVGHPWHAANTEYLVLDTKFHIENPGRSSQAQLAATSGAMELGGGHRQRWQVSVELVAHPLSEPLRPALTQARPEAPGAQRAMVVGPAGESVHTDRFGRIKVQPHWDRLGGNDQHSSCWVPVMAAWAGNQMGTLHVPRIGQEVVIGFIDGDIDQPYCQGEVATGLNLPPMLPARHTGLSGTVSRELGPERAGNAALGRSNHLVCDDTRGQMQVQVRSAHQDSQLVLGFNTRLQQQTGRGEARGQGFELRTDGHGVLRAGAGLLVTTDGRLAATGHAMSLTEAAQRLQAASERHRRLGDTARQAGAQQTGDQDEVAASLQTMQAEIAGKPGLDRDRGRDFPELSRPHLVVASAAGISTTSAGDTHIASGGHTAVSSQGHTSVTAGKSLLVSVRDAIRLCAFKAGLKLVAAAGDVDITALKNGINLLARLDIRMLGDSIHINATKEVLITGGGSYLRINAAGITPGTAGVWQVHAGQQFGMTEDSLPVKEGVFGRPELHDPDTGGSDADYST